MQAVRLHEVRFEGDRFQQEGYIRQVVTLRDIREHLTEIGRVARSVVGRQAHADEQDLRARVLRHPDHFFQVAARFRDWQAAQAIVRAELQYD